MALYLYYILLGVYGIALLVSLGYYLTRRAPGGDAGVGWALGIFYTAGLAGVIVIALLLRHYPGVGLAILSLPLLFLALPRLRRAWTNAYIRIPVSPDSPPLTLFLENNTPSKLHIKLGCWFGKANSDTATLFTTFDYYLEPLEKTSYPVGEFPTRLLAHKSKFVRIMTYEQVVEEHEGHTYVREIQPCMQFFNEEPAAFRSGKYTVVIDPK